MTRKLIEKAAGGAAGNVVRPLGFEPRIACAPGMYPNPL
jgi:hypothetical protein